MMSQSSCFDEEPAGSDDGAMEFRGIRESNFIFEGKSLLYSDEDPVEHELGIQLDEEIQSDINPTILWKHVVKGSKCGNSHGGSHVFKCNHCQKIYHGTYTRVYAHLMGHKKGESKGIGYCSVVKADNNLQQQIKREVEQVENSLNIVPLKKSKLSTPDTALHEPSLALSYASSFEKDSLKQDKNEVDSKVIRCFCANGIPFSVLRSPYWDEMVLAISKELGYKSPSPERAQTVLLENERNKIDKELDDFKQKWPQYGISVASSGWANAKNQPQINFFATNQFGSMFLHALDILMVEKVHTSISDYMLGAIERVGPYNVVQLIIDNSTICNDLGEEVVKVYPYIFWTPCMVHILKSILKDTIRALPWFEKTYMVAKGIVKYIIYHSHALEILQSYSDLGVMRVANGGSASHCIILHLLLDLRETLMSAVISDQWEWWSTSPNVHDKVKLTGEDVKAAVMSENFWDAVQLALSIIKPIYEMIKFSDQDGPIIGEVCERMDNMLGAIKDNLNEQEEIFVVVKEKVGIWWSKTNFPLQGLAYALTPKYYDEEYLQLCPPGVRKRYRPDQDDDIFEAAMTAICKMNQNDDQADTVRVQFMYFVEKKGKFSSPTAKRDARNPNINVLQWWKFHGGDTKELRDMAFRVLAQSISTSSVERPWSTYNSISGAKRNTLNANHADDLLYVHSNLRLLSRFNPTYKHGPYRKWDVNPDFSFINECTLLWEERHYLSLDDESLLSKRDSHSHNSIQDLFRVVDDVPCSNNQPNDQTQVTSHSRAYESRGVSRGQSDANDGLDLKGQTKKFL